MDPLLLATIGLPLTIVILVIIGFYKLFIKKNVLLFFILLSIILPGKLFPNFTKSRRY
jgi:multisubunit Na+/H+ antiporter MnhC subunit